MNKFQVDLAEKYIKNLPDNVKSVGRMGTYKYVDIDDIILLAVALNLRLVGRPGSLTDNADCYCYWCCWCCQEW